MSPGLALLGGFTNVAAALESFSDKSPDVVVLDADPCACSDLENARELKSEGLSPFVSYFRGLDAGIEGNYLELGAAGNWKLTDRWSCDYTAVCALSDQFGIDGKLTFADLLLSATYQIERFQIGPYVEVTVPFEDLNWDGKRTILSGGVSLSYSF